MKAPSYLLDTDVLSHLIRNPQGAAAQHIARAGEDSICTSVIVAAELRFGAKKLGSIKLTRRIDALLAVLNVLDLESPADEHYASIRRDLERKGTLIGPNDLLIAAQARTLGLTVVTGNEREFKSVRALDVENWLV
ncbi:MAG: type II toxin-antitoxin system VapC family toxin [Pseudomonadaceae bacterium]|nr:type II toxin-antitoxin system VapC family toxin [Pseudomonadaceae bacterium]